MSRRCLLACITTLTACFNPGSQDDDTSSDGSGGSTAAATAGPTSAGPAGDTTTTGDAGTTAATTTAADGTATATVADGSSSTGAGAGCGNGTIDADEACDDGDAIDGNGCNNDCQPSGVLAWLATYGDIDEDSGNGIAVDASGHIFAVGTIFRGGIDDDVWLSRHDPDGTEIYADLHDLGSYERGQDIAWHDTNDRLYVVGTASSDFPQLWWFDTDGSVAATDSTTPVNIQAAAVAARGDAIWWVGSGSQNGLSRLVGNALDVDFTVTEAFPITGFSPWLAVAVDASDGAVIAGASTTAGYLERRLPAGGALDWRTTGLPPVRGVAVSPTGEIVVVGDVAVPTEDRNVYVARFSSDGNSQIWDYDHDGADSVTDVGWAVAIDGADGIYVAAREGASDGSQALTVIKLDAGGNELWVTTTKAEDGWTYPADIAVDASGAASVVGSYFGPAGDGDADVFIAHFGP